MNRLRSWWVVGAVLLWGPSPLWGQLPVMNPAIRLIVATQPGTPPSHGSHEVYLVRGPLGSGAYVEGTTWSLLERRLPTHVDWTFVGNTQWGDHTYVGVLALTRFYHSSKRIVGSYGVLSWPEITVKVLYQCQLNVLREAYITVQAGTRVGVLAGSHPAGMNLDDEILDTVVLTCQLQTNVVQGAWVTDSYAGRWFDVEGILSTNQTGARVVTNRISVGDLTVREVVVNIDSNTVTTVNVLSNDVLAVVGGTGTTAQQVMGSLISGAIVRAGGGAGGGGGTGEVHVSVTVTNEVQVDWAEGHEYAKGNLPSTNWTWVVGSVQSSVTDVLGEPAGLSGVSAGHVAASPTWSIPVRMPSGVWSWEFDVGIWSSGLGSVVKRVLEIFVLMGLWFMLHRQIVDDLRAAWGAPQARSAGQTVLGTGSQLAGSLLAAAAILATLLTLTAAVLAWFLGGVGYPHAWVGELSLPSGLLGQFLRIGPWEVIVSSLTVWVAVWVARPYWIALTHGVVRFITGV